MEIYIHVFPTRGFSFSPVSSPTFSGVCLFFVGMEMLSGSLGRAFPLFSFFFFFFL
ncbi:hypothetical protein IQ07DRAFT_187424 [Pyrenochaeta sp. DS3sAY3a]|nr:hypothetical protein IQ07DRAFT_187424 [Pyrenochaeta sp. DS3sAY3a]